MLSLFVFVIESSLTPPRVIEVFLSSQKSEWLLYMYVRGVKFAPVFMINFIRFWNFLTVFHFFVFHFIMFKNSNDGRQCSILAVLLPPFL